MASIRAVLFDLDGTLVDTAADMGAALNRLLEQEGRKALPAEQIRPIVSKGSPALIRLGFGTEPTIGHVSPFRNRTSSSWRNRDATSRNHEEALRQRFLTLYYDALCVESRLFEGMDALLDELDARRVPWGVVTNKPGWLAEPLLEKLSLKDRCACIVSGDTLERRKPHPDPLLHACKLIDRNAEHTVYVGDDERDVQAGRAAGLHTLIALWGYIGADETPGDWGADGMITGVDELRAWLAPRLDG